MIGAIRPRARRHKQTPFTLAFSEKQTCVVSVTESVSPYLFVGVVRREERSGPLPGPTRALPSALPSDLVMLMSLDQEAPPSLPMCGVVWC